MSVSRCLGDSNALSRRISFCFQELEDIGAHFPHTQPRLPRHLDLFPRPPPAPLSPPPPPPHRPPFPTEDCEIVVAASKRLSSIFTYDSHSFQSRTIQSLHTQPDASAHSAHTGQSFTDWQGSSRGQIEPALESGTATPILKRPTTHTQGQRFLHTICSL